MKIAIIDKQTNAIQTWYEAEAAQQSKYGGPWGNHRLTAHAELPDGMDEMCVVAQMQDEMWTKEGEDNASEAPLDWQIEGWTYVAPHWVLVEDQDLVDAKTQRDRDAKLTAMRKLRDQKIEEADNQRKMHEDSDPNAVASAQDWSDYRIALRNVTDSYKDESDNDMGSSDLDAYSMDMSDFDGWPVKPS